MQRLFVNVFSPSDLEFHCEFITDSIVCSVDLLSALEKNVLDLIWQVFLACEHCDSPKLLQWRDSDSFGALQAFKRINDWFSTFFRSTQPSDWNREMIRAIQCKVIRIFYQDSSLIFEAEKWSLSEIVEFAPKLSEYQKLPPLEIKHTGHLLRKYFEFWTHHVASPRCPGGWLLSKQSALSDK